MSEILSKQGLILEGGAMRGMFTAGVIDVLMEEGITFDGIVGVSAGAAFGCNYKSHQIGRVIRPEDHLPLANTNLNRIRFKRHIFRINAPKSLAISAYPFNFLTFSAKNLLS